MEVWKEMPKRTLRESSGEVGIFWIIEGELFLEAIDVREAEPYGPFRVYDVSHDTTYKIYKRLGIVDRDSEYDDYPRGRVAYNADERMFYIYIDKCVANEKTINKIRREFGIGKNFEIREDEHYVCLECCGRQEMKIKKPSQKKIRESYQDFDSFRYEYAGRYGRSRGLSSSDAEDFAFFALDSDKENMAEIFKEFTGGMKESRESVEVFAVVYDYHSDEEVHAVFKEEKDAETFLKEKQKKSTTGKWGIKKMQGPWGFALSKAI